MASAVLVASLVALVFSGSASARQTRLYTGASFGPDGTAVTSFQEIRSIAVDQSTGDVYVYDALAEQVYKFDAGGDPLDFSALGSNTIGGIGGAFESGAVEQIAVAPAGSPGGTAGDIYIANNTTVEVYSPAGTELGTLGEGETCGVAVDPAGHLFVGSFGETIREYVPTANPPTDANLTASGTASIGLCNVAADGAGIVYASNIGGGETARLEGIADPSPALIEPGGSTLATDPLSNEFYLDEGDHVAAYDSNAMSTYDFGADELTNSYGIAVNLSSERVYVGDGGSGTVKVFGPFVEVPVVTTREASGLQFEAATLNGTVDPEGLQLQECIFEYGAASEAGLGAEVPCSPTAADVPPNSEPHAVTGALAGLHPNTSYRFRLTVTAGGVETSGEELEFSTSGPPRITEISSRADQASATLEATVDPRGAETSYRIESGSSDSYGNVATAGTIAAGEGPTRVTAHLAGLDLATTYHYRVVAGSTEGGESASPDQVVETLNSCGLTDDRCFELVSRAAKGPLASPGKLLEAGAQINFQAATDGSALAYTVPYGYPDATRGDAALYLARRGAAGWSSEQLDPPTLEPPLGGLGAAVNSRFKALSPDLGCGIVSSLAPLAEGASGTVAEAGGTNLYRSDDATGSYQTITYLPPVGPPSREEVGGKGAFSAQEYLVVGMSPDCSRVVFRTFYRYPGIPAVSAKYQLYEWDNGTLRNVAVIPGPGGTAEPVPAESIPGALDESPDGEGGIGEKEPTDYWRAVSTDGSRSVFTAVSQFGGDAGRRAVFLRDADDPAMLVGTAPATDVSQSETATPNNGNSRYWTASTDGGRVFFTARYGLAANGSSFGLSKCANAPFNEAEGSGKGCDLYEYDASGPAGARLTDLSSDTVDPKGASVVGVLDASDDGSYVYFVARGRLDGAGRSEAENLDAGTFNIYLAHAGTTRFVSVLGQVEALGSSGRAPVSTTPFRVWTSSSSGNGTTFVFESSLGVPGGVPLVHLYSAADGSTVCVSCRRDGRLPFSEHPLVPLTDNTQVNMEDRISRPTDLTADGRLYFYSFDPLAPGGVEGARNLYQWEHGQVSLIATEPLGVPRAAGQPNANFFGGASADGDDVYFVTPQKLTAAAAEGWNVYDSRVGGGFPEPSPPAPPCDATTEAACNSGGAGAPAGVAPATSNFAGPSNPPAKKKHHKKRRHKKKYHKKKHHNKAAKSRRADDNRRASK